MADPDSPGQRDPAADEPVDLGSLFGVAAQLESQLAGAEQGADVEIEGVAGGGAVRITTTGTGEFRSVHIDAAAVDPNDVDLLQDLVLAALHDVTRRLDEVRTQQLGALGDLLGGIGGQSGLGGLGDLFSGALDQASETGADADQGDEPHDTDPPTGRG